MYFNISQFHIKGTPIQIQRTGKVAGSRSFGDSIKRHIFNKGLLNKTPKKGSGSNINTVEEVRMTCYCPLIEGYFISRYFLGGELL